VKVADIPSVETKKSVSARFGEVLVWTVLGWWEGLYPENETCCNGALKKGNFAGAAAPKRGEVARRRSAPVPGSRRVADKKPPSSD